MGRLDFIVTRSRQIFSQRPEINTFLLRARHFGLRFHRHNLIGSSLKTTTCERLTHKSRYRVILFMVWDLVPANI